MDTASTRRLLVVEDDPGLNALITRKLQHAGFMVESALTGAAALEAMRRDPSALVLLDYLLPDMTAREIIEKLSAEGKEASFVIMTGHGDEKVAVEMMKLGARDYLVKDTDLGEVLPEVMLRVLRELQTEERLAATEAERKQTQQALQRSEQDLRTLAQNIPAIVYRVHLRDRSRTEFFNDMLGMITGYREDELRRGEVRSIDPLILPEDRASVVEIVKRAVSESRPFQVDYRITHRDGTIRHVSEQGRPVPGADGRPEFIDGVIFDATEAQLSAEIVKLNQERLAEAQRTSHLGSWLWDVRAQKSFWSAEFFRILGLEPDSSPPTQESFLARVHPEDRAVYEARIAEATRKRMSYDYDLRVVRPDGVQRCVHGETKVEYDAAGEPVMVSGTCQDITERRRAEVLLSASEERLRTITGAARDAIIMMDDTGFVTFWNPAAEAMFGYAANEAIGRKLPEFLAPERFRAAHAAAFDRFGATGEGGAVGKTIELAAVRKDGSEIPVELSMSAVASGGKWHAIGLARDISARKLAEEALRGVQQRREQLESIVDRSPAVAFLWRTDRQLTVDFVSANVSQFGYEADEFLSGRLHYIDIIHPEDRGSEGPKLVQYVVAGTVEFVQEYRIFTKAGEVRWVEDHTWVPRDPDGSVSHHQGIIVDVTARRQAEAALRESEEFRRRILDTSPDCIKVLDLEGRLLFMNEGGRRLLEIGDLSTVLNTSWIDFWEGSDRQLALGAVAAARAGGAGAFQGFCPTTKGTSKWWDVVIMPMAGPDGNPERLLATSRDISERRGAEERLRAEKERAQEYLDIASVMLVAMDTAGVVTLINRRGCEVLGWSEREVVGRDWFEAFLPERTRTQMRAVFRHLLAGEPVGPEYAECLLLTRSGDERVIAWHDRLLRDETGRVTGILSSGEDVTERNRAAEALKASEEKYRLVVEHANEAILVVHDGLVKFANAEAADMTGYRLDEIRDRPFPQLIHLDDRAIFDDQHQKRLRGEPIPKRHVFRIVRKDGAVRLVEVSATLTTWQSQPATLSFLTDVTERELAADELRRHRQHLEELVEERAKELKQTQEALVRQERLAAIGKVAGSMAHEIRNPLTAMHNAVYFLTNSLGPKLGGKEARHLEIVNQEVEVANGIITSVLDFARGRPAELVPLNLADVLAVALERANLTAGVQLRRSIPFDLPMIRVDARQMVQVFVNLLTNAS